VCFVVVIPDLFLRLYDVRGKTSTVPHFLIIVRLGGLLQCRQSCVGAEQSQAAGGRFTHLRTVVRDQHLG